MSSTSTITINGIHSIKAKKMQYKKNYTSKTIEINEIFSHYEN